MFSQYIVTQSRILSACSSELGLYLCFYKNSSSCYASYHLETQHLGCTSTPKQCPFGTFADCCMATGVQWLKCKIRGGGTIHSGLGPWQWSCASVITIWGRGTLWAINCRWVNGVPLLPIRAVLSNGPAGPGPPSLRGPQTAHALCFSSREIIVTN